MGRRMGVKRFNALAKTGQSVTGSLGAGVSGSVGYRKITKNGSEVLTEIYVDLAGSGGALYQPGTANLIIAHSASNDDGASMTAGNGNLTQVTQKENGVVDLVEVLCVEAPDGGDADIDLVYASGLKKYSGSAGTALVAATGSLHVGSVNSATLILNELQDQYLYLAYGGATDSLPAAEYTAGKLIIRLHGTAVPDDA